MTGFAWYWFMLGTKALVASVFFMTGFIGSLLASILFCGLFVATVDFILKKITLKNKKS